MSFRNVYNNPNNIALKTWEILFEFLINIFQLKIFNFSLIYISLDDIILYHATYNNEKPVCVIYFLFIGHGNKGSTIEFNVTIKH